MSSTGLKIRIGGMESKLIAYIAVNESLSIITFEYFSFIGCFKASAITRVSVTRIGSLQ